MIRLAVLAFLVADTIITSAEPIRKEIIGTQGQDIVKGVVSCGSKGQVLQTRITGCTTLPCDLHFGQTYFIEVDFIPFATHPFLSLSVSIIVNNEENAIINHAVPTSVVAGAKSTVVYPLTVTGSLVQGSVALRIQVSGKGIVELCSLASATIHQ